MWTKSRRSSITLNSLVYKCLNSIFKNNCSTRIFNHEHTSSQINDRHQREQQMQKRQHRQQQKRIECHNECRKCTKISQLPTDLKQVIFDYIIREKIVINVDILVNLIKNGGIYYFDLWTLCDVNEYKYYEIKKLLNTLALNALNLHELIIGGQWIYDDELYNGHLIEMFVKRKFSNLNILRVQQITSLNEFLSIFNSCQQLKILDICQPSLIDRDLLRINKNFVNKLFQLKLPSSIKNNGLIKLMNLFPDLNTLKCSRFDYITDYLNDEHNNCCVAGVRCLVDNADYSDDDVKNAVRSTLSRLVSLTITLPISTKNLLDIIKYCPKLNQLSVHVNDDLDLTLLKDLANLSKLRLINITNNSLVFNEKILPLIKLVGKNLEILSLEHFDVIDLRSIILDCINLKCLSIQYFLIINFSIGNMTYLSKYERNVFTKPLSSLVQLRLRPRIEGTISFDIIKYFFKNLINAEQIELYFCHNLSDNDLTMVMNEKNRNYFLKLKYLIIKHGHLISEEKINQLIKHSKSLEYLDIGKPLMNKLSDEHNNDDDHDYRFNQLFE